MCLGAWNIYWSVLLKTSWRSIYVTVDCDGPWGLIGFWGVSYLTCVHCSAGLEGAWLPPCRLPFFVVVSEPDHNTIKWPKVFLKVKYPFKPRTKTSRILVNHDHKTFYSVKKKKNIIIYVTSTVILRLRSLRHTPGSLLSWWCNWWLTWLCVWSSWTTCSTHHTHNLFHVNI